jgi:cyclic beta-1,2-glucan synthetase
MINPLNHTRTPAAVDRYRAEPYAVAADVYAHPMHLGRGGWTWYTGSAGWMYQTAVEAFLGLRAHGATFSVDPCIPSLWAEYSLIWVRHGTRYEIEVTNPDHASRGVAMATLDGVPVDPAAIPFREDRETHRVVLVMGSQPPPDIPPRTVAAATESASSP